LPLDRFGLTVTTPSARALSLYVKAVDRILSANAGAEALLTEAVALDPGFALAQVALARNAQLYGRMDEARSAAVRAAACVGGASERERRHVQALKFSTARPQRRWPPWKRTCAPIRAMARRLARRPRVQDTLCMTAAASELPH